MQRCLRFSCSRSAVPIAALALGVAAIGTLLPAGGSGIDISALGQDQFFNQEYDLAAQSFRLLADDVPSDPNSHILLAKALLYSELERLDLISSSAFNGDPLYTDFERPKPDALTAERITAALATAEQLCDRALERDSLDSEALYGLARVHALRANFQLMVRKAYFKALASGKRGRSLSYRVGQLDPDFPDGLLVAGINELVVGSLPWAVRAVIALSGYRGNKKKGLRIIAKVAADGTVNRHDARALLILAYRKEGRTADAARELEALARDFPRAHTYRLEAAAMRLASGEKRSALEAFVEVRRKLRAGEDRFDRMPRRLVEALDRRIVSLTDELARDAAP